MKSIREWMKDNFHESLEINFGKFINNTTSEAEAKIKNMIKNEINRIQKSDEFSSFPKEEINKKIVVALESLVSDLGSTKANASSDSSMNSNLNKKNDEFKDDPIAQEVK